MYFLTVTTLGFFTKLMRSFFSLTLLPRLVRLRLAVLRMLGLRSVPLKRLLRHLRPIGLAKIADDSQVLCVGWCRTA